MTSLLIGLTLCTAITVHAQDARWFETVEMQGFLSTSFTYNLNTPASAHNGLRVFDRLHNNFTFDVFQLVLKRSADTPGESGFRFDGVVGQLPMYTASAGLFGAQNIDILQAYATYIIPIGSRLTLDGGKFLTHMGYELIEGRDGWNDNFSRSYCFGYAIPFAHTGLRARYAFGRSISAMLMLANGWDNAVENNSNKTVGAQLGVVPVEGLNLFVNGIYGAEGNGDNSSATSVIDLVASWSVTDLITVGTNVDLGSAENTDAEDNTVSWTGVAGYLRFHFSTAFSLAIRAERFDDADGIRTGIAQQITEFTITPEYRAAEKLIFRGEFRMDKSNKEIFEDGGSFANPSLPDSDIQSTIGLNMLVLF